MKGLKSYTEAKLLWMARLTDAIIPAVFAVVALLIYDPTIPSPEDARFYVAIVAASFLTANIFHNLGLYTIAAMTNLQRQLGRMLLGWTAVIALLLLAAFAVKVSSSFSRIWTIFWYLGTLFGFFVTRVVIHEILRRWAEAGRLVREVVVVGTGVQGRRLVEYLQRPSLGFRVIAVFDDRKSAERPADVGGVPVMGAVDDLPAFSIAQQLDQIVVALPWTDERRIADVMTRLSALPVDIRLAPDLVGFSLAHCDYGDVGGLPVLNIFEKPLSEEKLMLKRIEDVAVAAALLLVFSPIMLVVAVLIKLGSPGPVFFRQTRFGFNNRPISVWKFRTMYIEDCTDVIETQALRDDPRVTPIGRWLRRTSVDEMPQLINVLQGTMSVVGPRPHAEGTRAGSVLFEEAVSEYAARHRVKPGLTGWAQVNGWRGETNTLEQIRKRVEHDLYYIEHWSIALDLRIIARTVVGGFTGHNAF
jgi:Undecaprenyl-phosphate glucose phosphotransferase